MRSTIERNFWLIRRREQDNLDINILQVNLLENYVQIRLICRCISNSLTLSITPKTLVDFLSIDLWMDLCSAELDLLRHKHLTQIRSLRLFDEVHFHSILRPFSIREKSCINSIVKVVSIYKYQFAQSRWENSNFFGGNILVFMCWTSNGKNI